MAEERPFVSVVVPVRNDRRIRLCIEALLAQTYPRERYEVIVVDNGSTDDTRKTIARYPVTLLVEDRIPGSYAARNLGVRSARGEVIALTDSDCRPTPAWIEEGVRALAASGAGLAGGHVRFVYSKRPSGAEIYDALNNMQQERDIRDRKVAKTANIFVRADVFAAIGLFPDTVMSGGDVYWTRKATDSGHRLVFARLAEVSHPTRRLHQLIKKQYRVGRGRYDRFRLEQQDGWGLATDLAGRRRRTNPGYGPQNFKPPRMASVRRSMEEKQMDVSLVPRLRVWGAGWVSRVTTAIGSATRWIERGVHERARGRDGS